MRSVLYSTYCLELRMHRYIAVRADLGMNRMTMIAYLGTCQ
jgi:hypothetical protein